MRLRTLALVIGLTAVSATVVRAEEPATPAKNKPTTAATVNLTNMQYPQFNYMLTQLNMTPDFTLDKETKQKLAAIQADYQKAQAKFMEDNKEEFKAVQLEQMAAFTAKDQEKIQAIMKKYAELNAKGPNAEEYLARTKAALPPEQLKIVEDKIKSQMEGWQKMRERSATPGAWGPAK